jgi:hypothetical protein
MAAAGARRVPVPLSQDGKVYLYPLREQADSSERANHLQAMM